MCINTVPGWASQLVFSDFLHFDTSLFIIDCYPAGVSNKHCLLPFFIASTILGTLDKIPITFAAV